MLNNLFLATGCAAVLTGTLYPLILDALTGARISVGPPFFNLTFGALMAPLLVVMPFGPLLAWKRADLMAAAQRLLAAVVIAVILGVIVAALLWDGFSLAPLGLLAGLVWLSSAAVLRAEVDAWLSVIGCLAMGVFAAAHVPEHRLHHRPHPSDAAFVMDGGG